MDEEVEELKRKQKAKEKKKKGPNEFSFEEKVRLISEMNYKYVPDDEPAHVPNELHYRK